MRAKMDGMTAKQFFSILPLAVLSALLWMALLYAALWESKSPGDIPVFVVPLLFLSCIGLSLVGIRRLYRQIGQNATALFPMLVFLCAIPIYLIMEVTVM